MTSSAAVDTPALAAAVAKATAFLRERLRSAAYGLAYVVRTLRRLGANRDPACLLPFYREPERLLVTFDAPGPALLTAEATAPRANSRRSRNV
jgi:hypothetical protein